MNPHRLVEFAHARGLRYGWRRRRVTWLLDVSTPGRPEFLPTQDTLCTPYARRSGTGIAPRPATDTLAYLTGRSAHAWTRVTLDALEGATSPEAARAREALLAGEATALTPPRRAAAHELVALSIGEQPLHDEPALTTWWSHHLAADLDTGLTGRCLACGEVSAMARLIPAYIPPTRFGITGPGDLALYPTPTPGEDTAARTNRAAPHGLMCTRCAMAIGAATTALTESPLHSRHLDTDTLLLWWTTTDSPLPLRQLLETPDPDALTDLDTTGSFCALLLAPNTGRVAMRHLWDEPVDRLTHHLRAWYDRIALPRQRARGTYCPGIGHLHAATGRWDQETNNYLTLHTRLREADLWLAALTGAPPRPHALAALTATRADRHVGAARVALRQAGGLTAPATAPPTWCCSVPGCAATKHKARGLCVRHYHQQRRTGRTRPSQWRYGRMDCVTPGCAGQHRARGYCAACYEQQVRNRRW